MFYFKGDTKVTFTKGIHYN